MAIRELSRRVVNNHTAAVRLLVVSREPAGLGALWAIAESNRWEIEVTNSGCEALERVQPGNRTDLVVLDLARGDADGLYTLRWLRRVRPDVQVMLLAHAEDASQEAEAFRLGACNYLVRPIDDHALETAIRNQLRPPGAQELETASQQVEQISEDIFFVASSPVMRKLRAQAELLAQVDVPVLLVGESGSGKASAARLIHKLSVRSGFRFRKVNCAALPGDVLEREIFGQAAGSFAGPRNGEEKIERADKGSLLLEDISEMPADLQLRLVQVMRDKRLVRLGGQASFDVDVRIMASLSGDVEEALAKKKLREDLYYRVSAFTVHVPPLRQRKEDIPLLLGYCMNQMARRYGIPARTFPPAVLEACQAHPWPGNLQELEAFVKRYLVIEGDEELAILQLQHGWDGSGESLPLADNAHPDELERGESDEPVSGLRSIVQSVKTEAERSAIAAALEQTHWNRKAAARLLQVSYRTLLYKIQQYQMSPPAGYLSSAWAGQGVKSNGNGS